MKLARWCASDVWGPGLMFWPQPPDWFTAASHSNHVLALESIQGLFFYGNILTKISHCLWKWIFPRVSGYAVKPGPQPGRLLPVTPRDQEDLVFEGRYWVILWVLPAGLWLTFWSNSHVRIKLHCEKVTDPPWGWRVMASLLNGDPGVTWQETGPSESRVCSSRFSSKTLQTALEHFLCSSQCCFNIFVFCLFVCFFNSPLPHWH